MLTEFVHHSAIVCNPDHSQHVTAWDLVIGPGQICREQTKARTYKAWVKETQEFVHYLCTIADWRMKPDKLKAIRGKPSIKRFFDEDLNHKDLLDATAKYL